MNKKLNREKLAMEIAMVRANNADEEELRTVYQAQQYQILVDQAYCPIDFLERLCKRYNIDIEFFKE
jgi:hypothetical protein